jgi:acetate kinase
VIIVHLGGGASITAVRAGISVDTSMGFSPTDGLIMANRCGDLDPMIALTLQREGMSLAQLEHLLNHNSGLMGICGTSDMRQVLAQAEHGEHLAQLAVEMFCYRIKKYIGAYCAVLGNVSALIFTGGIGEHAPIIRATILQNLEPLGFAINTTANLQHNGHHSDITATHSRSRILVIHAEEEREIARQMLSFSNDYTHP